MKKRTASLVLLLITIIWGLAFPIAKILLNYNLTASFIIFIRGTLFTGITFLLFRKIIFKGTKEQFKKGLIAGVFNVASFFLQLVGQKYTLSSHSSLITVTYVVIVPLVLWLLYKQRIKNKTIIAVILCFIGIVFLVIDGLTLKVNNTQLLGDLLTLSSAICFAFSIVYLGENCRDVPYQITGFMMGLCLMFAGLLAFLLSGAKIQYTPTKVNLVAIILSLAYLGLLSSALCQLLQASCQKYASPVSVSIIFSLEGFFGAVFSMILLHEFPTVSFVIGGILIIFSVFINEVNIKKEKLKAWW